MPRKSTSLPNLEMREGPEHASKVEIGMYPSKVSYDSPLDKTLMVLNSVLVGPNLTLAGGSNTAVSTLKMSDQSRFNTTVDKQY